MGFFDEIKQTAGDLGKKADNTMQVARFNSKIKELEDKKEQMKGHIGHVYYESRESRSETDFKTMDDYVNLMIDLDKQIADLRKQIGDIKISEAGGGVICPKCGTVVDANAKFCTKSGYKMKEGE